MTVIKHTSPRVITCATSSSGRHGTIYEGEAGLCRLRYGVKGCEDTVYDGLKQDDAQDLLAMWMAGARRDEMHIEAHLMGVR